MVRLVARRCRSRFHVFLMYILYDTCYICLSTCHPLVPVRLYIPLQLCGRWWCTGSQNSTGFSKHWCVACIQCLWISPVYVLLICLFCTSNSYTKFSIVYRCFWNSVSESSPDPPQPVTWLSHDLLWFRVSALARTRNCKFTGEEHYTNDENCKKKPV